jgi:hexulose-6-phosphate isomerase
MIKNIQKNSIGIMQGRLSPPINGMIQSFPKDTWRNEFNIASSLGFDAMELIFDGPDNPLFTLEGINEIRDLADDSKIQISSISNDFSMFYPLFGSTRQESLTIILQLIERCSSIGIPRVGISFEDNSAILNESHRNQAIESMKVLLKLAEELKMIITIETFLMGYNLELFIDQIGSPNLKVNFDTGNSCAYGEDSPEVIKSLGDLIGGIHVKDRTQLFGTTVPLGQGDTNLRGCFKAIKEIRYDGTIIIQGARGTDDIETAIAYKQLVMEYLQIA